MGRKYLNFVKHCFQNRRKVLLNKLVSYGKSISLEKEVVLKAMNSIGIDSKSRAENVSPSDYLKLYKSFLN